MGEIARIQRNFQITIPAQVRKQAKVHIGDLVEIEVREEGLLLRPVATIDRSQAWFWSKRWQAEEKAVEEDFEKGRTKVSRNLDEFLDKLDK